MENLKMKDFENAMEYSSKIIELVNQMRPYREDITEQRIVQKLLISLNGKYDHVVATIKESKNLSILTITELMGSLQAHKQRLSTMSEEFPENAL